MEKPSTNAYTRFLDQTRGFLIQFYPPRLKFVDVFRLREMSYGEELLFTPNVEIPCGIFLFTSDEIDANKILSITHSMRKTLKILLKKNNVNLWIQPYKYSITFIPPWRKTYSAVIELNLFKFEGA